MEHPDLTGTAGTPGNGPFMVVYISVRNGTVVAAKFQTYGCGPTIASGSMLTEMIIGRTIDECRELTAEELIEALDGVPPDKLHGSALLRVPGTLDSNLVATRATLRSHVMVRMLRGRQSRWSGSSRRKGANSGWSTPARRGPGPGEAGTPTRADPSGRC
jgi:nitrogen fixation NifU-like protein